MTALAVLLLAGVGLVGGLLGPTLIARIPEPAPEPVAEPAPEPVPEPATAEGVTAPAVAAPPPPKERYAEVAALPHLRLWLTLATVVAGALAGWRIGWHGALLPWGFLIPIGLALAIVDWRTRLLPTFVIAPSYAAMVALVAVAGLLDHSRHHLVGAVLGWVVMGGFYLLMWLVYPKGMGYGDVRLSGLLGLGLGYLGWSQLLVGAYGGLLVGALGGLALSSLGVVDKRHVPFGPFMVLGALLGVLVGPALVHGLGH